MPPLDHTLDSFELTTGTGDRVTLDHLVRRGPAVLVLLGDDRDQPLRAPMLHELGSAAFACGARLAVVSPGPCAIASELADARTATWLVDPDASAFGALGLVTSRRFSRPRRASGVFVVDRDRALRLAFVAERAGEWVPAAVVISRLKRLGARGGAEPSAAAATPAEPVDDRELLACRVASRLGLDAAAVAEIASASRAADLGMADVPDEIINKDGPLTDAEWDVIRQHPLRSAELLGDGAGLDGVREIVRASHEHLDGSGYPLGISGDRIPIGARVLVVVDAYLAMAQVGPYRELMGMREPLEELRAAAGALYDPAVVEALSGAVSGRAGAVAPSA